jgi:hypothetical protein
MGINIPGNVVLGLIDFPKSVIYVADKIKISSMSEMLSLSIIASI